MSQKLDKKKAWYRIRRLKFDRKRVDALKQMLRAGKLPDATPAHRHRIRALLQAYPFRLIGDDGKLALVVGGQTYVVVAKECAPEVISRVYHDAATGSYRGRDSLLNILSSRYVGITKKDIAAFLKRQSVRQQLSKPKARVSNPLRPQRPNQWWQMDYVIMQAPALVHANNRRRVILVVIDIFSKFTWTFALLDRDQAQGRGALQRLEQLFMTEGPPDILQADNEFRSAALKGLCARFGVQQRWSRSYTPQTNGAVERVNGTLKRALKLHMGTAKTLRWVDALPQVTFAYNCAVHRTTRHSPFEVFRGRAPPTARMLAAMDGAEEGTSGDETGGGAAGDAAKPAADAAATKARNRAVRENINANADRMLAESAKALSPLVVGDRVRTRLRPGAHKRHRRKTTLEKVGATPYWSEHVYRVAGKDGSRRFVLDSPSQRQTLLHRFTRHQLLRVVTDGPRQGRQPTPRASDEPGPVDAIMDDIALHHRADGVVTRSRRRGRPLLPVMPEQLERCARGRCQAEQFTSRASTHMSRAESDNA